MKNIGISTVRAPPVALRFINSGELLCQEPVNEEVHCTLRGIDARFFGLEGGFVPEKAAAERRFRR